MCLAAFAINASAHWPLVIASNRDEFFDRPALPLARWQTAAGSNIISGRDVLAGGTWLGMTPSGRVALLTNVREPAESLKPPAARSRGDLTMRWLESEIDADQFMALTDSSAYGGFNLVLGDFQSGCWTWLSNRIFDAGRLLPHRAEPVKWQSRGLAPGIYGLSNAALDTPWIKTLGLKVALADALANSDSSSSTGLEAALWQALSDRSPAGPDELPDTGLPAPIESVLSSAFVADASRGYGTRCSTLLIASALPDAEPSSRWDIRLDEKTYLRPGPDGSAAVKAGEIIRQRALWHKSTSATSAHPLR